MEQEQQNLDSTEVRIILVEMHKLTMNLVMEFRESLCQELNISIPTYYRIMRTEAKKRQLIFAQIDQKKNEIIVSVAYMELIKAANYIKKKYMAGNK